MKSFNNDDNNNDNNSRYDNFKIYNKQNNICINLIYDISYLTYKKKIFLKINDDYNLIINIFDENICDILINIYILKKKNKIHKKYFNIIEYLFEYIKKLNEINFLDQENFLYIILGFYKINILCVWISSFFDKYIFKELIDYKTLIDKVNNLYINLSKKILIFSVFDELYKIDEHELIIHKINYLTQKISFDLFMFYDSTEIFNEIINCFIYLNEIISSDNETLLYFQKHNPDIIIKNNKLLEIFIKYKSYFIKEYDKNIANYIDIYSNDIELYIKFKVIKSESINKFIKNIIYIDNM
jgi:hypothetical protein